MLIAQKFAAMSIFDKKNLDFLIPPSYQISFAAPPSHLVADLPHLNQRIFSLIGFETPITGWF
jgi:hypothetical protein